MARELEFGQWARKYECCVKCGCDDRPHVTHGVCRRCFDRERYRNDPKRRSSVLSRHAMKRLEKKMGQPLRTVAHCIVKHSDIIGPHLTIVLPPGWEKLAGETVRFLVKQIPQVEG